MKKYCRSMVFLICFMVFMGDISRSIAAILALFSFAAMIFLMLSSIKDIIYKNNVEQNIDQSLISDVPNPLIPWEIFPCADPDIFRCSQGLECSWFEEIWLPYMEAISEDEKISLKQNAPTDSWREWIDRSREVAQYEKTWREEAGLPFDHRLYVEDFKRHYARYYVQAENS